MTIIQFPQGLPSREYQTKSSLNQAQSAVNTKAWQREMERTQIADWFRSAKLTNRDLHQSQQSAAESIADPKLDAKKPSFVRKSLFITGPSVYRVQVLQDLPNSELLTLILQKADSSRGVIVSDGVAYTKYELDTPNLAAVKAAPKVEQYIAEEYPDNPAVARSQVFEAAVAASNGGQSLTPPPIRVHAEWYGKRIHVWLGLHGQVFHQNAQIASIIEDLRHLLASRGETLGSLVCNGRTFFSAENKVNLPKE